MHYSSHFFNSLFRSLPEPTPAVCPQDFGVSLDNIAGLEPHFSRHDGPGRVRSHNFLAFCCENYRNFHLIAFRKHLILFSGEKGENI